MIDDKFDNGVMVFSGGIISVFGEGPYMQTRRQLWMGG